MPILGTYIVNVSKGSKLKAANEVVPRASYLYKGTSMNEFNVGT